MSTAADAQVRSDAVAALEVGASIRSVASMTGASRSTVRRWYRQVHGKPPPRSVPIRDWPAISTAVLEVNQLSDAQARAKFLDLGDRVNAFIEAIDREDPDFLKSLPEIEVMRLVLYQIETRPWLLAASESAEEPSEGTFVNSGIDKHRPDWTPFPLVTSFDNPDADTSRPFGFRLPASWPEAQVTNDDIESSAYDAHRRHSDQHIDTVMSNSNTAVAKAAPGGSLRAIDTHYGDGCLYRLLVAWMRLDGIDTDTLRDILAWNPDD